MSDNQRHPKFAVVDALGWPLLLVAGMWSVAPHSLAGSSLVGLIAVWAAMRTRRALGHGRQPYRLTTHSLLRWSVYGLIFTVVLVSSVRWMGAA